MVRLSVAIRLPPQVLDVLEAFDREPLPGVQWSTAEQWLVKLRPLGHVDERLVPQLRGQLEAGFDGAPVAECILGPATRRLAGQWLGAPVTGLDDLAAAVFATTEGLVPVTHPQPFQADVVLARGRVPASLAGLPVSARWTAHAVALVADRSSPHRARHEDVATFPLGS